MAYTRQYPNSITPNGSTTRSCLENDDKELKRVLELLSNIGGLQLSGTKRQCVLYGSTDTSGNPSFLTSTGLTVSIDGSNKPVILSFANGFSVSSGTVDMVAAITSAVSQAWTIPASSTRYLYIDKDISTGLLSYGSTASEDTYSKAAPSSPILDQCYFNTNEMKMYHYNGSLWEQKWRVFVAKVVSDTSAVTITHYPMISKSSPLSYVDSMMLQRGRAYAIGDVAYSASLPSWARLECVTAGTTAAAEPDFSKVSAGGLLADGSVLWIIDDIRECGRAGDIFIFPTLHSGFVKANGATLKASEYPRLLHYAQDNSLIVTAAIYKSDCSKYVYDSTADTLQIPNMIGRVLQGGDTVASVEAGLPNITGEFNTSSTNNTGAITINCTTSTWSGDQYPWYYAHFNASKCSAIYGNSTTVQPPALRMIPQIKY